MFWNIFKKKKTKHTSGIDQMFRNIFKKKTPNQTLSINISDFPFAKSSNQKPNFPVATSSAETSGFPLADDKKLTTKDIDIPISFLKRLTPVAQLLTEEGMQKLHITSANFTSGSIIFNRGTEVDALIYVVKGDIFMEADNGSVEISARTFKALYPLSSGKFHYFTAIAKSDVTVIYISKAILKQNHPIVAPNNKELKVSARLKDNPFFNRFYQHFIQGELKTPNYPDIALKLRKAIQQDCGIADIVKIVNLDPVISAKLIQVVNSPIYRREEPISNCFDAVHRLGLTRTRYLVTAFSMNNLIKSKNSSIKKRMQYSWSLSIKISSISHTLAQLIHKADPDEALLAGLLHNIGVLPILTFADSLPEGSFQPADIDRCINEIQGQIGSIILEKWRFPDNLKHIPLQSTNWYTSTTEDINLNDIVLLAKYHHLLESPGKIELPLLITLPAFQKLENQTFTREMSLLILDDAKQQVAETMNIFLG